VISTTPGLIPVTTPVAEPTVATALLELVQVPPAGVAVKVVVLPVQMDAPGTPVAPTVITGVGFTVTSIVTKQPVARLYVIVATPGEIPSTTPVPDTVAVPGAPDDHVPPDGLLVRFIVLPTQTVLGPDIAAGVAFTVIIIVDEQPVDNV